MNARDELAGLILSEFHEGAAAGSSWRLNPKAAADHILAAGYRKPRTITTTEQLDALHMVVVRSNGGSIANIVGGRAYVFGYEASVPASTLALPATVLYEPKSA